MVKVVTYMTQNPGAYFIFTIPTAGDIERIIMPKMHEFFGAFYGSLWGWLEKKQEIIFPNHRGPNGEGGIVFLRTIQEPQFLRGITPAAGAMDEVGTENQEEAFRILQPAVMLGQPGFPHQLWVTTTPNVTWPWVKQRWQEHINPLTGEALPPADYPLFRARTQDNIHLPADQVGALQAEWGNSRWALQELEGQFITVTGAAFDGLSPDVHLRHPPADTEWVRSVVGLDFGERRPTALIEWRMDRSRRLWAVNEFYKRDASDYDWLRWCADNEVKKVICDPTGSDRDLAHWRKVYGINIERATPSAKTFRGRWALWQDRLRVREDGLPGLYISPSCYNLWDELMNLRHKDDDRQGWIPGTADHAYDAGAYGMSWFEKTVGRPTAPFTVVRRPVRV